MEILKEFVDGALALMPIFKLIFEVFVICIVLILIPVAFKKGFRKYRKTQSSKKGVVWRSSRISLSSLQKMDPPEFEEFIAELFRMHGYVAKAVGHSGDHGIDVEIEKDGVVSYVQCKRYSDSNKVGEPEVRNFLGSLDHKRSSGKGYFVTTGYFTLEAEKFADDNLIELIDGPKLMEYVRTA